MICLQCAELVSGASRSTCGDCGSTLVSESQTHIKRYGERKLALQLALWRSSGLLDRRTADKLEETLPRTAPEPPPEEPRPVPQPKPTHPEGHQKHHRHRKPSSETAFSLPVEPPPQSPAPSAPAAPVEEAHVGGAVLMEATAGPTAAVGGVEAFASLDEAADAKAGSAAFSKLNEYIWWFIGALLVLGGSVMGVREAWLALGGAQRQVLIAFALFVYHLGFVGMAAVVARRSATAGRVLSSIALGLLPIVFVALAALTQISVVLGLGSSLVLAGGVLWTLGITARRFESASGFELALVLLPSLGAELALGLWPASTWARLLVPLVGVGLMAFASRRHFGGDALEAPGGTAFGVATFGAVSLLLVTVLDTPSGGADPALMELSLGSVRLACLALGGLLISAVLAETACRPAARVSWPHAAPAMEVVFIAATAALALVASGPILVGAFVPSSVVGLTSVVTVGLAALLLARLEAFRPPVLHVCLALGALATALVACLANPTAPAWWAFGAAVMSPTALALASSAEGRRRTIMVGWAVALGLGMVGLATMLDLGALTLIGALPATVATALMVAVSSHLAVGRRIEFAHTYAGAALVYAGVLSTLLVPVFNPVQLVGILAGIAAMYRLAGMVFEVIGTRAPREERRRPFDDVALPAGLAALAVWVLLAPPFTTPWQAWPVALAALTTLVGAQRDHSRLVGLLGVLGLQASVVAVVGPQSFAQQAFTHGVFVLAAVWVAWLLRPAPSEDRVPVRHFLRTYPLPGTASGRRLFADSLAWAALVIAGLAARALVLWLGNRVDQERTLGIEAGGLLVLAAASAFFTRAFEQPRVRGSVVTLYALGAFAGLTAVVNRIGRPLPPNVVGRNLTLGIVALWVASLLLKRYGPALAKRLEHQGQGTLYRGVPLAGVAALGLVLTADALMLGAPFTTAGLVRSPALYFLGPCLALVFLAREWKTRGFLDAALAMAIPGLGVLVAQRSLLGPVLVQLGATPGQWVRPGAEALCASQGFSSLSCALPEGAVEPLLWNDAALGVAMACLLFAGLASVGLTRTAAALQLERPEVSFQRWTAAAAMVTACFAFTLCNLPAAALVAAAALPLALRRHSAPPGGEERRMLPAWVGAVGGVLLVHAWATAQPLVPAWTGPVFALLALVPSLPALAPGSGRPRHTHRFAVLVVLAIALVYAWAAGGPNAPVWVGARVLGDAFSALGSGGFLLTAHTVPATLAIAALALALASLQKDDGAATLLSMAVAPVAALAGTVGLVSLLMQGRGLASISTEVVSARVAFAAAAAAALTHAGAQLLSRARHPQALLGLRIGRDLVLLGLGVWVGFFSVLAAPVAGERLFETCVLAVGLGVAVCVHAVWKEKTPRHVYLIESAVVGVYAIARSQVLIPLPQEADALLVLVLGFFLVGVTVLARRGGTPPIAAATRRFASVLPIGLALLLPGQASNTTALAAFGSSMLYGALAAVEGSKWLGSLAATAANLALMIWALASGLNGAEVYLAPLGLLLMALGHLFGDELPAASRHSLRLVGGLLFYVPAGLKVSLQLAQGTEGLYSVGFGALCILGVAAGMALQIRAYLAFGTLFLTLDVLTNLLFASLRDHRLAFVTLSLAGLAILGAMIGFTLQRELVLRVLGQTRARLRGWD